MRATQRSAEAGKQARGRRAGTGTDANGRRGTERNADALRAKDGVEGVFDPVTVG